MAVYNTNDYYYNIIRKNIRKYRKEKKYTQQQLADATDLSVDYISETIMWNRTYNSQYPAVYRTYLQSEYWPYNFGINFDEQKVIQVVTPPYYNYIKYKAFPIHIYTPGD